MPRHVLGALQPGMTKGEVEKIIGRPVHISPYNGKIQGRPCGGCTITRPGSVYWLDLLFDADDRLGSFHEDCF